MLPYGIIIKQNKIVLEQSLLFWQKRFGFLSPSKFFVTAIPVLSAFAVIYSIVTIVFESSFSPVTLFAGIAINMLFISFLLYLTGVKTVKEYAATAREDNIQFVLTEETLEITTEFSKETVFYNEIELCFEKNFILTVITDKNAFPLSISKMQLINGDYNIFVSLLQSKIPGRYEKRGEN